MKREETVTVKNVKTTKKLYDSKTNLRAVAPTSVIYLIPVLIYIITQQYTKCMIVYCMYIPVRCMYASA